MKKRKQTAVSPRERYHGPLITNGVSLGYLPLCSWINFFFSLFMTIFGIYNDKVGLFKLIFCICILVNIFSILLSWMKRVVYRFQSFTYGLIAVNLVILVLNLDSMGLLLFIGSGTTHPKIYSLPSVFYTFSILLLFLISCGFYAWYYLPKNQGKVWQFNQRGTKDKKSAFANNFLITFGAVMFIPSLLTGYLQNAFGLFLGVLMTSTLTAVIVDAVYAAIYIRKHPDEDSL
ncbi:hypothetical protein AB3329_00070 [Streptococcus sp. H31]|uniref:hypothetical protein n=1 Tax=Streptococcus huangxiaojuni TaxID=3237239 RepID=UPI0034A31344